jgi:hypothetical protein
MSAAEKSLPPPVIESLWFWVLMFSLAALAGIATIGPKFDRREQSLETKFHARERGLGRESSDAPTKEPAPQVPHWEPIFTVEPVMLLIGMIAVVALANVARLQYRRLAALRHRELPTQ